MHQPGETGYCIHVNWIAALIAGGLTMGVLDELWLGVVARKLYENEIGELMRPKPNVAAAAVFYVVYVVGVVALVVDRYDGIGTAALAGAAVGFLAYATYDLTSMATIEGFTWKITAIDLAWGTALTAAVATAGEWASTI
ncbi:MAG: DUF2177 family protein [Ilumatobacteraceae bacterium]|nr:DUF2177 family protein [Ilumatobacteraceae bacterium]